jgi:hypothetical protein
MPLAPFHCAIGDAPEVGLPVAATVDISPIDDSVDTNRVRITGAGTIQSFGFACGGSQGEIGEQATITKRITFVPTGAGIVLHNNPPTLVLLGGVDRTIKAQAHGEYQSDASGNWTEIQFSQSDLPPIGDGGLVSMIVYFTNQTITIPPNTTKAWVRMWGGSGAAGGSSDTAHYTAGVGSAGYLEKYLSGLTPGNTLAFTHGAGGVTQNNGAGAWYGQPGGASILASGTQTISTLTANGSNGSNYGSGPGSTGGTATGGDVNYTGQSGSPSAPDGSFPGIGGARLYSRGPDGSNAVQGTPGLPGGMIIAWFR